MTENKRFTIKRKNLKYAKILENGKDLTGYFFTAQAEFICDKWNELSEENEQLKKILGFLKNDNAEDILNVLNSQENKIWELKQENEKLKAQLYCPFNSICVKCNNEYLVQKEYYYVSKCKKGHEQCSKVDVKYCDDFELKGDDGND